MNQHQCNAKKLDGGICGANGAHVQVYYDGKHYRFCGRHRDMVQAGDKRIVLIDNPIEYKEFTAPTQTQLHIPAANAPAELAQARKSLDEKDHPFYCGECGLNAPMTKKEREIHFKKTGHGNRNKYGTKPIVSPMDVEPDPIVLLDEFQAAEFPDEEEEMTNEVEWIAWSGHARLGDDFKEAIDASALGILNMHPNAKSKLGGSLGADSRLARLHVNNNRKFQIVVPRGYEDVFIAQHKVNGRWVPRPNGDDLVARFKLMLTYSIQPVLDERGRPRPEDGTYVKGANFMRNITMIETSQLHVAISNQDPRDVINHKESGGTFHFIREVHKRGLPIWWIDATRTVPVAQYIEDWSK